MMHVAVLALALFPQSIERSRSESHVETAVYEQATGMASTSPSGIFEVAQVSTDLEPAPATGVRLVGFQMDGEVSARVTLEFIALDPAGTVVYLGGSGSFGAVSSTGRWGAIDPYGWSGQITPPSLGVTAAGDTLTYDEFFAIEPFTDARTELPTSDWQYVLMDPVFGAYADGRVEWQTYRPAFGGSTAIDLQRYDLTLLAAFELTRTYELGVLPTTAYCTSPAGSTGATAQLAAYGSAASGSEWLTVQATGLPAQAAAILFQSDMAGSSPVGSANLCLAGQLARRGGVQIADQGTVSFDIDLVGRATGETLHFQVFHRDPLVSLAASTGVSLVVQ